MLFDWPELVGGSCIPLLIDAYYSESSSLLARVHSAISGSGEMIKVTEVMMQLCVM